MIIVNFKNYKTGPRALSLAKLIERYDKGAIVAVSAADISDISSHIKLAVYAQHVDLVGKKSTGFLSAKTAKAHGAQGTLLNHSEHPLTFSILKQTIRECKSLNLKTIVCAKSIKDVRKIMKLKPYAIAYEDPKLIGTGKSVTEYRPEELHKVSNLLDFSGIRAICGAGISDVNDIAQAYLSGYDGVLVASAIADNPKAKYLLKSIKEDLPELIS